MEKHDFNWNMRFFIVIFSLGILSIQYLHCQNFVSYSNQEIEEADIYVKGNLYQKDFLLFMDLLTKSHPAFALESEPPFNIDAVTQTGYQWADRCRSMKSFWCRIQQIAALINDGHTTLIPEVNMNMIYPVILFFDNEGVYVRGINEEYKDCLGKKISHFNGHTVKTVFDSFRNLISSDNIVYSENKFVDFIQLLSMWEYTPYCSPDSVLHITFTDNTNVSMSPIGKDKIKIAMQETSAGYKTIRQKSKTPFHYNIVKEKRICYFQFNSCIDQNSVRRQYLARYPNMSTDKLEELVSHFPIFDNFLGEMFETIRRDSITTLVIDVRDNTGGDSRLCDILLSRLKSFEDMKHIHSYTRFSELWKRNYPVWAAEYEKAFAKLQQPFEMGKLYDNYSFPLSPSEHEQENSFLIKENVNSIFKGNVVFIQNAKTYSSAGMLITVAHDNSIGITIGEESSYKPCNYGDLLAWQLPNTKLKGYVSHKVFVRPDTDKCSESSLIPTVHLHSKWEDVLKGKDICWEWVLDKYGTNSKSFK